MNNKKRIILIFWGVAEYGGVPTMFKNIQNESLDNYEIKILQIKTLKDFKEVLKYKRTKIVVSMTPIIGILPVLNLFGYDINVYFHSIVEWKGYRTFISLIACLFSKKLYVTQEKALPKFIRNKVCFDEIGIALNPPSKQNSDERVIKSLLTVSRLDPIKRLPDLAKNLNTYLLKNDISLNIIGDGIDYDNIPKTNNIFLKGYISNKDIDWDNYDVLIINSLQEGFPVVALEALTAGVGVISRDVGNLKELSKIFHNIWIFNTYEELIYIIKNKYVKPSLKDIKKIKMQYGADNFASNF